MNLLKETIEVLNENGKTEADVEWCGTRSLWFTWDEFKEVADVEYDSGFGAQEVAVDLVIVGKDFYMDRNEYDGAENWNFNTQIKKPSKHYTPKCLTISQAENFDFDVSCGWESFEGLNNLKEKML